MRPHWLSLLCVIQVACEGESLAPLPPPPPTPLPPASIERMGAAILYGTVGQDLSTPPRVKVLNGYGAALGGVTVNWNVVRDLELVEHSQSVTDLQGVAQLAFQPPVAGTLTVSASVAGLSGIAERFTLYVAESGVLRVAVQPMFDCYGTPYNNDQSGFAVPEEAVPVGTVVEFIYAPWLEPVCTARIVTITVPPGALPVDSGDLHPGQSFRVVLNVAGDWFFTDAINGGTGKITVH